MNSPSNDPSLCLNELESIIKEIIDGFNFSPPSAYRGGKYWHTEFYRVEYYNYNLSFEFIDQSLIIYSAKFNSTRIYRKQVDLFDPYFIEKAREFVKQIIEISKCAIENADMETSPKHAI